MTARRSAGNARRNRPWEPPWFRPKGRAQPITRTGVISNRNVGAVRWRIRSTNLHFHRSQSGEAVDGPDRPDGGHMSVASVVVRPDHAGPWRRRALERAIARAALFARI